MDFEIIEIKEHELYLTVEKLKEIKKTLFTTFNTNPFQVKVVKTIFGTNRELTILVLEYLDKIGFTKFENGERIIIDINSI